MILADTDPAVTEGATYMLWTLIAVGVVVNFFPAFVAALRGHRSTLGIGAVCLFFGWTVVGWLVALIWSLSDTGRRRR